jgi:hypothetical protein
MFKFQSAQTSKPYWIANRPGVAHTFQQDHEMNPSRRPFRRRWTKFLWPLPGLSLSLGQQVVEKAIQ